MIDSPGSTLTSIAKPSSFFAETDASLAEIELPLHSGLETQVFENAIPPFVAAEMERLYEIASSTLLLFEMCNGLHDVSTYVARTNGRIATLLLFRRIGSEVVVLNEMIRLQQDELRHFAAAIFARYKEVSTITLTAVQSALSRFPFPSQQFHFTEDIVLALPNSDADYLAQLGKNMRSTVKRFQKRVERDFPTYRQYVYEKEEIDEMLVREIFHLHLARMEGKGIASSIDETELALIIALTQKFGMVHVATIEGRVSAGLICWRIGSCCEMRIIAHNPAYDEYKLGTLSCYHTICASIARGDRTFRFGWGRSAYKFRFLGVSQEHDRIRIYRSWLHAACCIRMAISTAISGMVSETRLWFQNAETRNDILCRMATRMADLWRLRKKIRQLKTG